MMSCLRGFPGQFLRKALTKSRFSTSSRWVSRSISPSTSSKTKLLIPFAIGGVYNQTFASISVNLNAFSGSTWGCANAVWVKHKGKDNRLKKPIANRWKASRFKKKQLSKGLFRTQDDYSPPNIPVSNLLTL